MDFFISPVKIASRFAFIIGFWLADFQLMISRLRD
jgi:hypothetical protein